MIASTEAYRTTRQLYAKHEAELPHGVYLRPTWRNGNHGRVVVLSLDYVNAPRVLGVGSEEDKQHYLDQDHFPPTEAYVQDAVDSYVQKRQRAETSPEGKFVLKLMASALNGNLRLPCPHRELYFIHQEWKFSDGKLMDILALEPEEQRLWVIELKSDYAEAARIDTAKGGNALDQAKGYAHRLWKEKDQYYGYFEGLARAMATAHGAPDGIKTITINRKLQPCSAAWWPGPGCDFTEVFIPTH